MYIYYGSYSCIFNLSIHFTSALLIFEMAWNFLQDIFNLIVGTFSGLGDIHSPSFGRRVVILETVARYRSCVVMLDLECNDLVNEMFSTFLAVVRYYWSFTKPSVFPLGMEVLAISCNNLCNI